VFSNINGELHLFEQEEVHMKWGNFFTPCFSHASKKLFFRMLVLMLVCFVLSRRPAMAEEPATLEERMLRMEQEVQTLRQENERLQNELDMLREQMDAQGSLSPFEAEEAAVRPQAGYKRGFYVGSEDGLYKLQLGGRVTSRFTALDSDHPLNDEFRVMRARVETDVNVLDYYDLKIAGEFAESPKLKDGYLDVHYVPWARFRMGQFKVPFTWEYLASHKYIDFAERSFAVDNMRFQGRDIGAMLHGKLYDNLLEYQIAVLNGTGENNRDNNDSKDIAGRLFARPLGKLEDSLFSSLYLGISGTFGDQNTDFSDLDFKTIPGTKFVDFASDTTHTGDRTRLGTEFLWPIGPASLKAEWMRMWLDDFELEPMKEDLDFSSWYISGSYLLTGEQKTLGRVVPNNPFNPNTKTWGAWELAARYSQFNSDDDLFDLGMAKGTDQAEGFTLGLSWYLNELFRVTFNYEHADFDDDLVIGGRTVDDEDAFIVQCQLEF